MSRQAFNERLRPKHVDHDEASSMLFEAWQAATNAALERAAAEVTRIDNETWFQNQLEFGIACRKAIRALKDEK